ncbi:hypothetical protein [Jonesia denitrificans]|uniref:Growth/differentiation factor n=1 Tax=Jonesia denitrificans (strain ATCC 14870 / DSM 20603 / BCRC 15368 / CIP 55.134 / JCM 11481 / NBRC 15587 / NCTC 10816 / Prevot 55134) TaxID=471856 RepID=C7R5I8_JONDD|nr:hypothetical protein [Jonesia denitrificans]ACV09261.1 hypothetical protein Jden_1613 [Jonesia denitrificans DSM 20603]ASE09470.1 growth/differentiation factor [Jonesia denitrificans]QXB44018.1 hypothetical protein I6L70_03910 [Jonesia denitrificans]SQH21499.1 Uncharacterised protein [Jonesia denitrificans]
MDTILALAGVATVSVNVDGDGGNWLPLLFLLSGPAYYFFMYTRYRNRDKRHNHEVETSAEVANLRSHDAKVKTVRGVSNSRIKGDNARSVIGARN